MNSKFKFILGFILGIWLYTEIPLWIKYLPNPLPKQRFTDTWNAPRGDGRKHQGVDIFAKTGTPIQSTTNGIILRVSENKLGGKFVAILSPTLHLHYYAHLHNYAFITPYQWVSQGEVIGYVGKTGNAKTTPAHLHYGIYTYRGAVNPYFLIKQ